MYYSSFVVVVLPVMVNKDEYINISFVRFTDWLHFKVMVHGFKVKTCQSMIRRRLTSMVFSKIIPAAFMLYGTAGRLGL